MLFSTITRSFITSLSVKIIAAFTVALCFWGAPTAYAERVEGKTIVSLAKVSINSANAEILADAMSGVGLRKAEAIVAYRKENGKFKSIDELALVKGIGASTIEKNRPKLTL